MYTTIFRAQQGRLDNGSCRELPQDDDRFHCNLDLSALNKKRKVDPSIHRSIGDFRVTEAHTWAELQ